MHTLRELRKIVPIPILLLFFTIGVVLFLSLGSVMFLEHRKEAIHNAARTGDIREVEEILDRHPEWIENRNRIDLTPLLDAVRMGQTESTKVLIARGANVNATWNLVRTGDGEWTALHIAANWNWLELVAVLVQAGVDINALSIRGETAYDVAFRGGHLVMLDRLDKNGGVSGDEVRKRKQGR